MSEQSHNPYQFIVDADHRKPKKSLLPSGNSKQSRIMIVAGGVLILIIAVIIVFSLISAAGNAGKAELVKAAQKQTELVRISKIGIDRAKSGEAKNLATTVNLSLQSDQATLVAAMKAAGTKVSAKELALGKDAKTDTALNSAEQANRFDEIFTQTIQKELVEYQQTLDAAHSKTDSKKLKATLKTQFDNAGILAKAK